MKRTNKVSNATKQTKRYGKRSAKQPQLSDSGPVIHINTPETTVYTDGAVEGNGQKINIGGYAFIVVEKDQVVHEYGRKMDNTTNNRCELQAIIDALYWIEQEMGQGAALILSDSQYCVNGITKWKHGWIRRNWNGVANDDMWKEACQIADRLPNVQYKWIRGHQEGDHPEAKYNRKADELAVYHMTGKREEDKPVRKLAHTKVVEISSKKIEIDKADKLLTRVWSAIGHNEWPLVDDIRQYLQKKGHIK